MNFPVAVEISFELRPSYTLFCHVERTVTQFKLQEKLAEITLNSANIHIASNTLCCER